MAETYPPHSDKKAEYFMLFFSFPGIWQAVVVQVLQEYVEQKLLNGTSLEVNERHLKATAQFRLAGISEDEALELGNLSDEKKARHLSIVEQARDLKLLDFFRGAIHDSLENLIKAIDFYNDLFERYSLEIRDESAKRYRKG